MPVLLILTSSKNLAGEHRPDAQHVSEPGSRYCGSLSGSPGLDCSPLRHTAVLLQQQQKEQLVCSSLV